MTATPNAFEVYGFTIKVHTGGRRVWPPSFKRFIKNKMEAGEPTVADVMETCSVSQSLFYKWRADVKASRKMAKAVSEEQMFSEIVIEEKTQSANKSAGRDHIHLTTPEGTLDFPAAYGFDDVTVLLCGFIKSRLRTSMPSGGVTSSKPPNVYEWPMRRIQITEKRMAHGSL